jgi:hypothetical protein
MFMSMFGWLRRRPSDVRELLAKVRQVRGLIPPHLRHLSDELVADSLRTIKGWSAEEVESYRAKIRGGATPESFVHGVLIYKILGEIHDGGNEVYPGVPNLRGVTLRKLHQVVLQYGVARGFVSSEDAAQQRLGLIPGGMGASDAGREQAYAEEVEEWIASCGNQGKVDWALALKELKAVHGGVAEELRALCVAGCHARRDVAEIGMICINIAQACQGGVPYDMDWIRGCVDEVLEASDIKLKREHLIASGVVRFAPDLLRSVRAGSSAGREVADLGKDEPKTPADERLYMVFGGGFERVKQIARDCAGGRLSSVDAERFVRDRLRSVLEIVYDEWRLRFDSEVEKFVSLADVSFDGDEESERQTVSPEGGAVKDDDTFGLRVDQAIQSYCESSGLKYMEQLRALRNVDGEFANAEDDLRTLGAALAVADKDKWYNGSGVAYFIITCISMRKDGPQAANNYLIGACRVMQKKLRAHFSNMGNRMPTESYADNLVTIAGAFGEAFKAAILLAVGSGCDGSDVGSALAEVDKAMETEGYLDNVWREAACACCRSAHELGGDVRHGRLTEEAAFGAAAGHMVDVFVRAMFQFERHKKGL